MEQVDKKNHEQIMKLAWKHFGGASYSGKMRGADVWWFGIDLSIGQNSYLSYLAAKEMIEEMADAVARIKQLSN